MPYTSLNGHMFSVLHKDGSVALRLPAAEREAFLKKYKTTLSSQDGTGTARVRRRARFAPGEDEGTAALFRDQPRVRRISEAKTDD